MKYLISILCLTGFFSCSDHKPDIGKMADRFATLEYRAVTLREQRFALANQVRFTEDTLMHCKTADKERLQRRLAKMNYDKKLLTTQSLALADTIKRQLDDLTATAHLTSQERLQFNDRLNTILAERF